MHVTRSLHPFARTFPSPAAQCRPAHPPDTAAQPWPKGQPCMRAARTTRSSPVTGPAAVSAAALAFANVGVAAAEGDVLGAERADAVPGSYIVALNDASSPRSASASTASSLVDKYGG